jgi:hypothetical protein
VLGIKVHVTLQVFQFKKSSNSIKSKYGKLDTKHNVLLWEFIWSQLAVAAGRGDHG